MENITVSGVGIKNYEFAKLNEISLRCTSPSEFLADGEAKKIIEEIVNRGNFDENFPIIIKFLINTRKDFNSDMVFDLNILLSNPSILSIKSFRSYLRYKGELEWEKFRAENVKIYQRLSYTITDYLQLHSAGETIEKFKQEIIMVSQTTGKSIDYIENLITKYKTAMLNQDFVLVSDLSANIKGLVKEFNAKAKEKYVKNYIEDNICSIKDKFNCIVKNNSYSEEFLEQTYQIILKSTSIRNKVRTFVNDEFNVILEADEIEEFISNILHDNNNENLKKLGLLVSPKMFRLQATKSYNRLESNYLSTINEMFSLEQVDLINTYISEENKEKRKSYNKEFTSGQKNLLNVIRPIMLEAGTVLDVKDGKIVLNSSNDFLDALEEREVKKLYNQFRRYDVITKFIFKIYRESMECIDSFNHDVENELDDDSILFTDDNYELNNMDYLIEFEKYAKLIEGIDVNSLNKLLNDRVALDKLKKLFINDGLISCFICDNNDVSLLCDIINRFSLINKGTLVNDFTMNRLSGIFRRAESCKYIDDFTLALLGEEVAEKIVYNIQFLQGKNTPDKISLRLRKATDLMLRAEKIDTSGVPYFDSIEYNGLSINRYNNNDSKILTSGIDSNTCFKICANDNDYLFYSILNKNGIVAYFEENGQLCGRITAHVRNNCLMINGIRNVENEYGANSLEQKERNDKIIEVVKAFGEKMIELSSDSNCPIDFVISNKSGILESNDYDRSFGWVDEMLFTQYVDTYNDDFEEFRKTYDGVEQFFQEVPHFEGRGEKQPFTTDFGHYPLVMIAKREGKNLNRLWDISVDTPDSIYKRPSSQKIIGKGELSKDDLEKVRKIDALSYYYNGGNPSDYELLDCEGIAFDYYEIDEDNFTLVIGDKTYCNSYDAKKENFMK